MKKDGNSRDHLCIACGGELAELDVFERMPASAQDIPSRDELARDEAVDLRLCQCRSCGLVQFDTEPVHYYKDVIRAGGGSSTMRSLRHEEYARLLRRLRDGGKTRPKIIEVGCGRGEFLKMWADLSPEDGMAKGSGAALDRPEVAGLEHSHSFAEEARREGLCVYDGFAEHGDSFPGGPYDAFVQFNFLEHQPDPADMLRTIRENLKPGGLGLLTVPSFEYILEQEAFYELLRDHIANYTTITLQKLLRDCGFEILEERIVNRDTIEVLVKKTDGLNAALGKNTDISCAEGLALGIGCLQENYRELRSFLDKHIEDLVSQGKSLAIWGASHQGFTLCSSMELGGKVKYIIDSAPFKQGRFSPGSHIPIVPPGHFPKDPSDEILIAAPGYTDEIAGLIRKNFGPNIRILALRSKEIEEYRMPQNNGTGGME